ncbi:hypothetical protein LOK49_LG08G02780 [Camellia lanceoleosa]|uniref:Uncharacterized protein n=1 Tax=Camellia lanceoleosa TaxID=1840588 RepID=A0ACC0GXK6_9ERIC|nr:hypothetical protein LOK49_LG08G02780 [Camellia lanceoleosa]
MERPDSSRSIHYDPSSLHDDICNLDFYKPVHSRSQDNFPTEFSACTSGLPTHAGASTSFQSFSNGPHHLNRQFTFPSDIGLSNDTSAPSTSSSKFERTRSNQDDGFQRGYGYVGSHFDSLRESYPRPYANRQIPNQWQMAGSDLSLLSLRNTEGDGYPYHILDYSNLACSVNGYTVFRPSNGH